MTPRASRKENGWETLHSMLSLARNAPQGGAVLVMPSLGPDLDLQPYIFCDESGKWHDKDFICLCGYLSSAHDWSIFVTRWGRLLAENEMPAMHMTSYWQECRERGWSEGKAEKVLAQFTDIIREHVWLAFAVGFDVRYYRTLPPHVRAALKHEPPVLCLERLLRLVRNRLHAEQYDGRVSLIIDEDTEFVIPTYRAITKLRRTREDLRRYIGAVSFADDEFLLPLQAADVLANLTSRYYRLRLTDPQMPMPPILDRLLRHPEHPEYGIDLEHELWDEKLLAHGWEKLLAKASGA